MKVVTVLELLGLGAALVGAGYALRGAWPEAAECFMVLIVVSFLAAVRTE